MTLHLHLIDVDEAMVTAWRSAFAPFPEVAIGHGDILEIGANCIVSPANSHGFMDGGVDDRYRSYFGPGIEEIVRDRIISCEGSMLPVGSSLVVVTGNVRIPYLLVAPTMEMPEAIPPLNCYRAMRAVLRIAETDERLARHLCCPGMGTGVGMVPPMEAAEMMARAYGDWKRHRTR